MVILKTERLILRPWRESDLEPFAKMNANPKIREFFISTQTPEQSNQSANIMAKEIESAGWGFWAVELPGVAPFIGCIGIRPVDFSAHFTPAVEIGWRLDEAYWGKGYAVEGAFIAMKYGFEILNLPQIVSFAATTNNRSRNIMDKLGMHREFGDDFDHPNFPPDHKHKRHVLYRIDKEEW